MTPAELKAALAALGWTTGGLARFLGCDVDRVRNWIRPTGYRVPPDVAAWLTRRVAFHRRLMEDDPPPRSSGCPNKPTRDNQTPANESG